MTGENSDLPDAVTTLLRWQDSGGSWQVAASVHGELLIDLLSCTGELMGRLRSSSAALAEFLGPRRSSED